MLCSLQKLASMHNPFSTVKAALAERNAAIDAHARTQAGNKTKNQFAGFSLYTIPPRQYPDDGEGPCGAINDDAWPPSSAWNLFPLAGAELPRHPVTVDARRSSLQSRQFLPSPTTARPITYAETGFVKIRNNEGKKGSARVTPSRDLGLFRLGHVHDQVPLLRQSAYTATRRRSSFAAG